MERCEAVSSFIEHNGMVTSVFSMEHNERRINGLFGISYINSHFVFGNKRGQYLAPSFSHCVERRVLFTIMFIVEMNIGLGYTLTRPIILKGSG